MEPAKHIDIKTIATHLGLRPKRVLEKVHKLGLTVHADQITEDDAITLIETYVHNNKASANTKAKAETFVHKLKTGKINVSPLPKKANPQKTKSKRARRKAGQNRKGTGFAASFVSRTVQMGIQALESSNFKFVALIVAICVQIQHSAHWYERIVPDGNESVYAAYGYAFMVDLFILVVTMEGKVHIAKIFAVLTFFANILYFQFWIGFNGTREAYTNAVSSILISGIIAYIIFAYSELFVIYRKIENPK